MFFMSVKKVFISRDDILKRGVYRIWGNETSVRINLRTIRFWHCATTFWGMSAQFPELWQAPLRRLRHGRRTASASPAKAPARSRRSRRSWIHNSIRTLAVTSFVSVVDSRDRVWIGDIFESYQSLWLLLKGKSNYRFKRHEGKMHYGDCHRLRSRDRGWWLYHWSRIQHGSEGDAYWRPCAKAPGGLF